MLDGVRGARAVGVAPPRRRPAALRTLLVHRHEDLARFDRAFDLFWRAPRRRPPTRPRAMRSANGRAMCVRRGARRQARVGIRPTASAARRPRRRVAACELQRREASCGRKDFARVHRRGDRARREALLARADLAARACGARGGGRRARAARSICGGWCARNMKHGGELLELPRRAAARSRGRSS